MSVSLDWAVKFLLLVEPEADSYASLSSVDSTQTLVTASVYYLQLGFDQKLTPAKTLVTVMVYDYQ